MSNAEGSFWRDMTDKEIFKNMLQKAGIEYIIKETQEVTIVRIDGGENVVGYNGFFTEFNFDKSGNLATVGIWE